MTPEQHRVLLAGALRARRHLLGLALAKGDLSTARAILEDTGKLLGLYPPSRTELTGKDGMPLQPEPVGMTDDERALAVAAILARFGAASGRSLAAQADPVVGLLGNEPLTEPDPPLKPEPLFPGEGGVP